MDDEEEGNQRYEMTHDNPLPFSDDLFMELFTYCGKLEILNIRLTCKRLQTLSERNYCWKPMLHDLINCEEVFKSSNKSQPLLQLYDMMTQCDDSPCQGLNLFNESTLSRLYIDGMREYVLEKRRLEELNMKLRDDRERDYRIRCYQEGALSRWRKFGCIGSTITFSLIVIVALLLTCLIISFGCLSLDGIWPYGLTESIPLTAVLLILIFSLILLIGIHIWCFNPFISGYSPILSECYEPFQQKFNQSEGWKFTLHIYLSFFEHPGPTWFDSIGNVTLTFLHDFHIGNELLILAVVTFCIVGKLFLWGHYLNWRLSLIPFYISLTIHLIMRLWTVIVVVAKALNGIETRPISNTMVESTVRLVAYTATSILIGFTTAKIDGVHIMHSISWWIMSSILSAVLFVPVMALCVIVAIITIPLSCFMIKNIIEDNYDYEIVLSLIGLYTFSICSMSWTAIFIWITPILLIMKEYAFPLIPYWMFATIGGSISVIAIILATLFGILCILSFAIQLKVAYIMDME